MTGAAITANLMRNNSFRVDSVQKLLGPHKFSQCLERERQAQQERQTEEEEQEKGGEGKQASFSCCSCLFFYCCGQ